MPLRLSRGPNNEPAKHLQMLSTLTSRRIENVNAARERACGFSCTTDQWDGTAGLLEPAQSAGCSVAAVTDLNGGSNRELTW